jgi:hypothetical protein
MFFILLYYLNVESKINFAVSQIKVHNIRTVSVLHSFIPLLTSNHILNCEAHIDGLCLGVCVCALILSVFTFSSHSEQKAVVSFCIFSRYQPSVHLSFVLQVELELGQVSRERGDLSNQLSSLAQKKEAMNEELMRLRQRLEQANETNVRLNRDLEDLVKDKEEKQVKHIFSSSFNCT